MMTYTQCKLEHLTGKFQTAWLPSQLVRMGKKIQLMGENGWVVIWVGQTKTEEQVNPHHG